MLLDTYLRSDLRFLGPVTEVKVSGGQLTLCQCLGGNMADVINLSVTLLSLAAVMGSANQLICDIITSPLVTVYMGQWVLRGCVRGDNI